MMRARDGANVETPHASARQNPWINDQVLCHAADHRAEQLRRSRWPTDASLERRSNNRPREKIGLNCNAA
jgi:hypothetical protein